MGVDITSPPGMARYLVGRQVDGEWVSYWCKLRNLHKHPTACLLAQIAGTETRVPVTTIERLPDDAKLLAQDGKEGGWAWGETGYISGASFKKFYLGEIGTVTFVGSQVEGETAWMTPDQEMTVRAAWDGGAPVGQLLFQWEVRSGPVELVGDTAANACTLKFTGVAGEVGQVVLTVAHKWNDSLTPQVTRLIVLGQNPAAANADVRESSD